LLNCWRTRNRNRSLLNLLRDFSVLRLLRDFSVLRLLRDFSVSISIVIFLSSVDHLACCQPCAKGGEKAGHVIALSLSLSSLLACCCFLSLCVSLLPSPFLPSPCSHVVVLFDEEKMQSCRYKICSVNGSFVFFFFSCHFLYIPGIWIISSYVQR